MDDRPDLAAMVVPLGRALLELEAPILRDHGLSMWAYIALSRLATGPVRGQNVLAEAIGADKTRIIDVLDDLQERGLIRRAPDPADRRARLLAVTDQGQRLREQVRSAIRGAEQPLLAQLSAVERAAFLRALQRLAAAARTGTPVPDESAPPAPSALIDPDGKRKGMTMADGFVSVSRHIKAPAERLFALLTDSANHPLIDGSGMVREPAPAARVSGTGDAFLMNMHHERFGDYQMRSEVVEYQAGRRLVWEPVRVPVSPEEQKDIGDPLHYRWGYELTPDGPDATLVTETFDCSRSPEDLREAVKEGEGWRDAMTASLVRLELLAKTA